MTNKKINWLSVLQGFSMLLVVVGHVSLTNIPQDSQTPIAAGIERTIYTFHMPLFIFISGWLFFYTCIRKEKNYKDVLKSKLKRLGIPFLVFTLVATVLKSAFPALMNRPVTVEELKDTFLLFRSNPLGEMWFVVVLLELMMLYPIYKWALKKDWSTVLLVVFSMSLFIYPPQFNVFYLSKVMHMAPFFVGGLLCCRYEWQKWFKKPWTLGISMAMFVLWNILEIMPDPWYFLSVSIGIVFSFSLCMNLAKFFPSLFDSFRNYTFQIFLMGIFFQMAMRWTYVKIGNEWLFVPMWLLSVIIGVYAPTMIAKYIEKKAPNGIRVCFGL